MEVSSGCGVANLPHILPQFAPILHSSVYLFARFALFAEWGSMYDSPEKTWLVGVFSGFPNN